MAKDDYQVIAYKILAYYYACLKQGVDGNCCKAKELAGCNDLYFGAVLNDLKNSGYLNGAIISDMNGEILDANVQLTLPGAEFFDTNSTMNKVGKLLGKAFSSVLQAAVAATSLL